MGMNKKMFMLWKSGGARWVSADKRILQVDFGVLRLTAVYSPTGTYKNKQAVTAFYETLDVVMGTGRAHFQVICGDWNAWIPRDEELYGGEEDREVVHCTGRFGFRGVNANSTQFIEFATRHGLTVTNTHFRHHWHKQVSWRYSRTRKWYSIDHVLVPRNKIGSIHNARSVLGCYEGLSDHVPQEINITIPPTKMQRPKRIGTVSVKQAAIWALGNQRDTEIVQEKMRSLDDENDKSVNVIDEEMSSALVDTLLSTCKTSSLTPKPWTTPEFLALHDRWRKVKERFHAGGRCPAIQREMLVLQKQVSNKARALKREWLDVTLDSVNLAFSTGRVREGWLQLKPLLTEPNKRAPRVHGVHDPNGRLVTSAKEVVEIHAMHLQQQLNTPEQGCQFPQWAECPRVDIGTVTPAPPSLEEITTELTGMRKNRTGGVDNITVEALLAGGSKVLHYLHALFQKCWSTDTTPTSWGLAEVVTLLKPGKPATEVTSYRPISLLVVQGKLYARCLLRRIEALAERVIGEWQGGFRAGRGLVDQIAVLKQAVDAYMAEGRAAYVAFLDLRAAYDLTPRSLVWQAMQDFGFPEWLICKTQSLYSNTRLRVRGPNDINSKWVTTTRGLKQGCVISPVLFSLFLSRLTGPLRHRPGSGLCLRQTSDEDFRWPGRWAGRKRKGEGERVDVSVDSLGYADDMALCEASYTALRKACHAYEEAFMNAGMELNYKKTEWMTITPPSTSITAPTQFMRLRGGNINRGHQFKYLGVWFTASGSERLNFDRRLAAGSVALHRVKRAVRSPALTEALRLKLMNVCVFSAVMFGAELWALNAAEQDKLDVFGRRAQRVAVRRQYPNVISTEEQDTRTQMTPLSHVWTQRSMRYAGHVARMAHSRLTRKVFFAACDGMKHRGRRMTWRKTVDTMCSKITTKQAENRQQWNQLAESTQPPRKRARV